MFIPNLTTTSISISAVFSSTVTLTPLDWLFFPKNPLTELTGAEEGSETPSVSAAAVPAIIEITSSEI